MARRPSGRGWRPPVWRQAKRRFRASPDHPAYGLAQRNPGARNGQESRQDHWRTKRVRASETANLTGAGIERTVLVTRSDTQLRFDSTG